MTDKKPAERGSAETIAPAVTFAIPGKLSDCVLTIPGRLPGLNEYTDCNRDHKYKGASMKRKHQADVQWCIRQCLRKKQFSGPVFLLYTFYERDRRRDHDNVTGFAHKVIQDALVESKVIANDGWNEITGDVNFFEIDSKNPRIEVRFIEQEREPQTRKRG